MKNSNLYLKIILTIIAFLLLANLFISFGASNNNVFAVTQTSEFQDQFKFLLGPKSNIKGNLMVLEYPGKGIYYINLDNIDNFFEGKTFIEFTVGGKKFTLQKPESGTGSTNPTNDNSTGNS